MNYDICLIGTKDTTIELAKRLLDCGHTIDLIITVNPDAVDAKTISGYASPQAFADAHDIELFAVADYSMQDEIPQAFFKSNSFGIGICMGWQRLIPKQVLSRFNSGIFGFHGSCGYLPYGRGRSPLNWSIVNGDTRFILNMFRYDEFADSPNVFQRTMFEITPFDTIRTLQYKNLLASCSMSDELLRQYSEGNIPIRTDSKDPDTQYPKRTPADGRIDFLMKTRDIHNLIRGVTRPFPGAFCFDSETGEKVTIWEAAPFEQIMDFSDYHPGEVIDVFDGKPIIRTIDGSLIVTKYDSFSEITRGELFQ